MKITITQDFDTPEEAAAFLYHVQRSDLNILPATPAALPEKGTNEVARTRKPRADAGQKREPYGPRTPNAEGTQTGTQPSTTAGAPATEGSAKSADKAAPSAPQPNAKVNGSPQVSLTDGEFPATLEGARAALKKLHDAPGKGMDACMAALKANGVGRVSDLKPAQFVDFIKYVLEQIPAAKK